MIVERPTRDEAPTETRMRRLAIITAVSAIAPLTLLGVALTAGGWWEGMITGLSFLLTLGVIREWSLDGFPRRSVLAVVVTGAAWAAGALFATAPLAFVPFALVSTLMLVRTRRRLLGIAVLAPAVTAVGAASFILNPSTGELATTYLLTPFLGSLFIAGVILVSERAWLVARRLEQAKEIESQLAVARERMRFVDDLHDIQGQSLHVIGLKSALAQRMVRLDPGRAEEELAEIRRLARETISETRVLAYGRHELNLAAEAANAKRLCEAAGIAVEVRLSASAGAGAAAHPLLAQVLREATTNLLRHARPTTVVIAASADAVEIVNDGVPDDDAKPERGLARLRDRVESAGGVLTTARRAGRFMVRVSFAAETVRR